MSSQRLLTASVIIAVAIILGFALSIPHVRDGNRPPVTPPAGTTTPLVTYHDAYRRGVHTISGYLIAPNACTPVSATATPVTAGTTTIGITLALSMPADQGVCLQLPSTTTFSTQLAAPRDLPISATVNGAAASTSTSTKPS